MPKYNTSLKIKLHTFKQQPKPVHCDPVESKQLDYQMMEERLMVQHKHAIAQNSDTSLLLEQTQTQELRKHLSRNRTKKIRE